MVAETFTRDGNVWRVDWEGQATANGSALVCSVMTPNRGRRFLIFIRGRNGEPWVCSRYYARTVHPEAVAKITELNAAERAADGREPWIY